MSLDGDRLTLEAPPLMIRGAELAAITEAAAVIADPDQRQPVGASVIPISGDLTEAIAEMS